MSRVPARRVSRPENVLILSTYFSAVFHHDSPYDACSPHSNRNARRAPVKAFDYEAAAAAEAANQATGSRSGSGRPGLSPLAAATMRKMNDSAADVNEYSKDNGRMDSNMTSRSGRSRSGPQGVLPVLGRTGSAHTGQMSLRSDNSPGGDANSLSSHSAVDRDVDAERAYQNSRGYMTQPSNVSHGRSDVANPMADIWGVTSEPWQDFAAPAATKHKTRGDRNGANRPMDNASTDDLPSAASSVLDMETVMTGRPPASKSLRVNGSPVGSPTLGNTDGAPKRSKSLIKRIKTARQHPNVPPPSEDTVAPYDADAAQVEMNRPPINRARTHHHSPSMPMASTMEQRSDMYSSNSSVGRSGTLRAGSGNGYRSTPERLNDDGGPRGAPSDRNTSSGSHASGVNSGGLGRNGSIFNRFRGGGHKTRNGTETVAVAR